MGEDGKQAKVVELEHKLAELEIQRKKDQELADAQFAARLEEQGSDEKDREQEKERKKASLAENKRKI